MIIDFHTHLHTPEDQANPFWRGRCPMTIENVREAQKAGGIDVTVVSLPMHELRHMDRAQQLEAVRKQNRYFATIQEKYDDIYAIACAVPHGDDAFLREWERAIREDGLKGAWILASLQGHYPDDDECLPFFQLATELDVPVVIHPPSVGFGEERMKDYRLASSIGRPMDNALAISRLIVRGIFERFPTLKLVGSHLGGGICEMIGRMDYAYNLQDEAFFLGSYESLSEDDVSRIDLLSPAGGALRLRDGGRRPFRFRHRCAAAQILEEPGRRGHPQARPPGRRRAQGVCRERQTPAENLTCAASLSPSP